MNWHNCAMVLKLSLILIFLAPLSLWGPSSLASPAPASAEKSNFSSEKTQELKKLSSAFGHSLVLQAREKELWRDPQWLRLGHYRKKTFGGYESPFRGKIFIADQGFKNPELELAATLETLFSDKNRQCDFLARTTWIKNHFDIPETELASCEDRKDWKRRLGAQEMFVVFASSDLSSAGSSFGHTFLRAHNPKNIKQLDLLDYGINYAAVTGGDDGASFALKGLLGFYPGSYSMLPFHQKMREYTNLEGRNLWEYKLKLTPDEVEMMIDHLLELDSSVAPYYFLDDNCSRQILELLEIVKPDLDLTSHFVDATIPLDTVKVMAAEGLLEGEVLRLSLQAEWRDSYAHLNRQQKSVLKDITKRKLLTSLPKLSPKEQAETLEASMRYIAIQDYRDQKDSKDEKYQLSVARARLGAQTEALPLQNPKSPLTSSDSSAWYLGYGKYDDQDFYRFKYHRAFHDLLSDDSGISTFSHLEVLSFDFRYFPSEESLNLKQFVLLKMLSTGPINELDTPLTWKIDVGTEPKLAPYFTGGVGYSYDLAFLERTRTSLLVVSENYHLLETAQPYLGLETLLMTKASIGRGLLRAQYLLATTTGRFIWDLGAGLSFDIGRSKELRFEFRSRDKIPEAQVSIIF
jgi:hypothetical protein